MVAVDVAARAGLTAGGHIATEVPAIRQTHQMVRRTRCRRRSGNPGSSHLPRAQALRHHHAVSARRDIAAQAALKRTVRSERAGIRSLILWLAVTAGIGLLIYLVVVEMPQWGGHQTLLWIGLLLIALAGAICENASSFDVTEGNTSIHPIGINQDA